MGVIILSISALFWLVVIEAAVADAQDAGSVILAGLFLSIFHIGVGIRNKGFDQVNVDYLLKSLKGRNGAKL